jgi:dynein heavy chain
VFVETILRELRLFLKEMVATMDNNVCQSLMRIVDSFLVQFTETEIKKITPEEVALLEETIEHIYVFAVIWSLCCTTTFEGRAKLNQLVRKLLR